MDFDGYYFVLRDTNYIFQLSEATMIVLNIVRFTLLMVNVFEVATILSLIILIFITFLIMLRSIFSTLLPPVRYFVSMPRINRGITEHLKVQLAMNAFAPFQELGTFFLILIGLVVFVVSNFVTIKLYDSMPFAVYAFFPSVSGMVAVVVNLTLPLAHGLLDVSTELKRRWGASMVGDGSKLDLKCGRRRLKGMRPFCMWAGFGGNCFLYFLENNVITRPSIDDPPWYRDPLGILFNGVATAFLSFIFTAPILFVVAEVDPIKFVLPDTPGTLIQTVTCILTRLLICTLALAEIVSSIGLAHLTLIMLTLYSKSCLFQLKFYRKPENSEIAKYKFCRKLDSEKAKCKILKLEGLSDLEIYSVLMVQCHVVRQYSDISAIFIMGPGFVIDVMANYVVIMLHGKIPGLLYLIVVLLATLVPIIIMGELPEAGKSNSEAVNLLQDWKKTVNNRMKRRKLRSLRPIGFWVGPFFLIKRQTLSRYLDVILNYTVNAILVL
ncbi:hypothetical protein Fcan01_24892 [Folsomia candida]|uniref:Uncharacterized protein n=1 Tax=Folsomia candida TaxID=158441 RepID=A0A226D5M3_FOLCA|nr:hypothetical protein Fcan01_24892 [Folsomia candida]